MTGISRALPLLFLTAAALGAFHSSPSQSKRSAEGFKPLCAFLPENTLSIPTTPNGSQGISFADFQIALRTLEQAYPRMKIQADWEDAEVNAWATRDEQDAPVLVIPGGIARHPEMSADGMIAVLCHEVGHFLGGAPKAPRGDSGKLSWSSAEGEADYFASAKCMRTLWPDERENEAALLKLSASRRQELTSRCRDFGCMRALEAGRAATRVFAASKLSSHFPEISEPEAGASAAMIYGHPSPQCRLDTFVAGALCRVPASAGFDDLDPAIGACVGEDRVREPGARPRCWFNYTPIR